MTGSGLRLTGYRYSVYTRSVKMALAEKGLAYADIEVDPFDGAGIPPHAGRHPFGLVPVLQDGAFRLYETAAILHYLDARFPEPPLRPHDPRVFARMVQVIGIADAYVYRPLVRGAFAHGVFRPAEGLAGNPSTEAEGLAAAARVLAALEEIAAEGMVLNRIGVTLCDCHLAPMLACFAMHPEAPALLGAAPRVARWLDWIEERACFAAAMPPWPPQRSVVSA